MISYIGYLEVRRVVSTVVEMANSYMMYSLTYFVQSV